MKEKLQIQFIIKFKKTYFFINVKLIHLIEEQRQTVLQTTFKITFCGNPEPDLECDFLDPPENLVPGSNHEEEYNHIDSKLHVFSQHEDRLDSLCNSVISV